MALVDHFGPEQQGITLQPVVNANDPGPGRLHPHPQGVHRRAELLGQRVGAAPRGSHLHQDLQVPGIRGFRHQVQGQGNLHRVARSHRAQKGRIRWNQGVGVERQQPHHRSGRGLGARVGEPQPDLERFGRLRDAIGIPVRRIGIFHAHQVKCSALRRHGQHLPMQHKAAGVGREQKAVGCRHLQSNAGRAVGTRGTPQIKSVSGLPEDQGRIGHRLAGFGVAHLHHHRIPAQPQGIGRNLYGEATGRPGPHRQSRIPQQGLGKIHIAGDAVVLGGPGVPGHIGQPLAQHRCRRLEKGPEEKTIHGNIHPGEVQAGGADAADDAPIGAQQQVLYHAGFIPARAVAGGDLQDRPLVPVGEFLKLRDPEGNVGFFVDREEGITAVGLHEHQASPLVHRTHKLPYRHLMGRGLVHPGALEIRRHRGVHALGLFITPPVLRIQVGSRQEEPGQIRHIHQRRIAAGEGAVDQNLLHEQFGLFRGVQGHPAHQKFGEIVHRVGELPDILVAVQVPVAVQVGKEPIAGGQGIGVVAVVGVLPDGLVGHKVGVPGQQQILNPPLFVRVPHEVPDAVGQVPARIVVADPVHGVDHGRQSPGCVEIGQGAQGLHKGRIRHNEIGVGAVAELPGRGLAGAEPHLLERHLRDPVPVPGQHFRVDHKVPHHFFQGPTAPLHHAPGHHPGPPGRLGFQGEHQAGDHPKGAGLGVKEHRIDPNLGHPVSPHIARGSQLHHLWRKQGRALVHLGIGPDLGRQGNARGGFQPAGLWNPLGQKGGFQGVNPKAGDLGPRRQQEGQAHRRQSRIPGPGDHRCIRQGGAGYGDETVLCGGDHHLGGGKGEPIRKVCKPKGCAQQKERGREYTHRSTSQKLPIGSPPRRGGNRIRVTKAL